MANDSSEQCLMGKHYVLDPATMVYHHQGDCADLHAPDPKQQVVNTTQKAVDMVKKPQPGFDMSDTVFK